MKFGIQLFLNNFGDQQTDRQIWTTDLEIGCLAESLGFDFISGVEHHFNSYSLLPDNISLLSYLAARTKTIKLMTGAVILPWNDPVRVAERIIQLDYLSGGRVMFGMGRGLARREYEAFGIDMNEARGRFDEAAKMILEGLESGFIQGDGPHYRRDRLELRPRPLESFVGRTACVAMSSDSVPVCAELGAKMMCFASKSWDQMGEQVRTYRELYEHHHGRPAPKPIFANFLLCDHSRDRASELAHRYMGNYYDDLMDHYELAGQHWKGISGYKDYEQGAEAIAAAANYKKLRDDYVAVNDFGTPDDILQEYERRREIIGPHDVLLCTSYGGMSLEEVRHSVELFASRVIPEAASWD